MAFLTRSNLVSGVVGFAAGLFLIGFLANLYAARAWEERLTNEVSGSLSLHLAALELFKEGDPERAIKLLDRSVDDAVTSLAGRKPYPELRPSVQRVLKTAKRYRSRYRSTSEAARNAQNILDSVVDDDQAE